MEGFGTRLGSHFEMEEIKNIELVQPIFWLGLKPLTI
jgi:hypothetical protein